MEAVVELSSMLADEERNDIRLEAALAKLFCSEVAWQVADEMVQIRGGRGYETAESLRARGERPVPAEQILRDLRISRIFEGSTEIMKLLIAREAVDQHLSVAGALVDPKTTPAEKAESAKAAAGFYAKWLPQPRLRAGPEAGLLRRMWESLWRRNCGSSNARAANWPAPRFTACRAGRPRLEKKQGFLGRLVDIGAELFAMTAACVRAKMLLDATGRSTGRAGDGGGGGTGTAVLSRLTPSGRPSLLRAVAQRRRRQLPSRAEGAVGGLRVGRSRHHRPLPDERPGAERRNDERTRRIARPLDPSADRRAGSEPQGSVTAPRSAPVTSRAYLASTPWR